MWSILFLIYQQSHIHPVILLSSKLEMLKYYNKNTHKVVRNIIITLLSPWLPHNITWRIIVRLSLRHSSSLSSVYTRSHASLYKELPNYVIYKRTRLTVTLQIALVLQYDRGPSSSFLGKQLGAKHLHCLCNIRFYFPHFSLLLHISLKESVLMLFMTIHWRTCKVNCVVRWYSKVSTSNILARKPGQSTAILENWSQIRMFQSPESPF